MRSNVSSSLVYTWLRVWKVTHLFFCFTVSLFQVSATAINKSTMSRIAVCCDLTRVWRVRERVCQLFKFSNPSLPTWVCRVKAALNVAFKMCRIHTYLSRLELINSADLTSHFLCRIKLLIVSDMFIPGLRFKFSTNAANNNKEHILHLHRSCLSERGDL